MYKIKQVFFKTPYFYIGLIIFYLILVLAPNKIIYFTAYPVVAYFFYRHTKNITSSIVYSLVLAFFSELGIRGNLLVFGIFILVLLPFALRKKLVSIKPPDIFIFLFFLWHIVVLVFYPFEQTLYGLLILGEMICLYYLLRVFLIKTDFKIIPRLFISMLLFQIFLSTLQILLGHNIGLLTEAATVTYPYGLTATEEENIFRVTASYAHANMYAVVLITILPFLFLYQNWFVYAIRVFWLINLLFTHARLAWFFGLLFFGYFTVREYLQNYRRKKLEYLIKIGGIISVIFVFLPFFIVRLFTIPQAIGDRGSFGFRIKLIQEAIHIINQSPIIGIGINRFQEVATANAQTDIFTFPLVEISQTSEIHNLFAEIATETGLPALLLFCLFLLSIYKYYFQFTRNKTFQYKKYALIGLTVLLIISQFHPVYLVNQFRLFFLFAALILV